MSPACKSVNPQAQAWVSVSDLTDAVEAINEDILLDDDDFQCRGGDQSLPTKLEVALSPKPKNPQTSVNPQPFTQNP